MKIGVRIYKFCMNALAVLGVVLLAYLSYLNIVHEVFIDMNPDEIPRISYSSLLQIGCYLAFSIIGVALLVKVLNALEEKKLFRIMTFLYLLAGSYLIFNIQPNLRADPALVNEAAKSFSQGNFESLKVGGYMFRYPHQVGLVSFFRILMLFSENTVFLLFVYLFSVILINYIIWKICEIGFKEQHFVRKMAIALSFLFLPQLFFICFLYGTIPGLLFVLASVLFMSKYHVSGNVKEAVIGIVSMGIACVLRSNYLIAGLALIIVLCLQFLKKLSVKDIIVIVMLTLCIFSGTKMVKMYYEHESNMQIGGGVPPAMHIAMGLQENAEYPSKSGWYNGFVWHGYQQAEFDPDKATEMSMEIIEGRISTFLEEPTYMLKFFERKIITTWCEPTFQSVWSGPLEEYYQTTYTPIVQSIYRGGDLYCLLNKYEKCILIIVLICSFVGIFLKKWIDKKDLNLYENFATCYLLGGFLFHLFWETKSQYVYPYIFLIIPIAASEVVQIIALTKREVTKLMVKKNIS